jgi:CDP-glucose 4,6-dehydratase
MNAEYWKGKKVFVTGHSGFKGSWLCMMLLQMRAEVYGYSKSYNPTTPNLYDLCKGLGVYSTWADINDYPTLERSLAESKATHVIHMAAQTIVKDGFEDPYNTFHINTMGTLNLLETCRKNPIVSKVLVVTTDKVYGENLGLWGYRETDPLKAADPYSTSKACAELITDCFRTSYMNKFGKQIMTARAGNVIGGGDFNYRLIPMTMESLMKGEKPPIWDPTARRPWQSVFDCLNGYLMLMETQLNGAWNFGPRLEDCETVGTVVDKLCALWSDGTINWNTIECPDPYSLNTLLMLDTTKSNRLLNWHPKWNLETTIKEIVKWYKEYEFYVKYPRKDDIRSICERAFDRWLNS